MNRDRSHAARDPLDRRDDLLAETSEEERVADLHELCRHEAPLVVAPHEDRVLGRALHATVQDDFSHSWTRTFTSRSWTRTFAVISP